jgi:hypothetical protein
MTTFFIVTAVKPSNLTSSPFPGNDLINVATVDCFLRQHEQFPDETVAVSAAEGLQSATAIAA